MLWKGKKVNINNYNEVFAEFPLDIREVVRSAILDDTPIEHYIKRGVDPYLLWQIKLGLDEGLDSEWFSILRSGNVLKSIRDMKARNINIEPLKEVLRQYRLDDEYYKYILNWYNKGIALEKYNFSIIPKKLLETFGYGVSRGYPMHMFNTGVSYNSEYILYCLKILANGKNISKFLSGSWDDANMALLTKYSSSKYYDKLIDYVTINITPSILEELYECCKVGMPLDEISAIDDDGIYVYSKLHLEKAREAFLLKLDYRELLNVKAHETTDKLFEMQLSQKRLHGVLKKG